MKRAGFLFISMVLFLGFTSCVSMAESRASSQAQGTYKGSVPFIFVERDVEFAIYPNGEFDFAYVGPNYQNNPYNGPRRPFSYNGGYNYDMYLQFDRFGAVVQVESVPIYYDYYGRITQAGNVIIRYTGDYVTQVGNMHVIYERGNVYLASSGYVNSYNRHLRPQPWHSYYARPYYPVVYTVPYRENYKPRRYEYEEHRRRYNNRGRSNYDNGRRTFVDPTTQAPRREAATDNRRENIENPTDSDRGRNNTTTPRREGTTKPTEGRRGSSTTPTENTRRGRSSTNQQESNRRETATPSNSNSRRGESSSTTENNSRRESNTSGSRRGTSPNESSNRRR
ncbi:MAG TPA: hypothetical protein VKX30_07250 [Flavobacteriaceae bacterium]|nr:hypothetical protein [Flavobacteriaceae bacterium]